MKTALFTLLLIPFLSVGQVSKKDKKSVDRYALSMCDCMNNLVNTLHPKTVEVILLMAEKGEEEAMNEVDIMVQQMDTLELYEFLGSFTTMESDEFLLKMSYCDDTDSLEPELKEQMDKAEGDAHDYLLEVLDREETCKILKSLYDIGQAENE